MGCLFACHTGTLHCTGKDMMHGKHEGKVVELPLRVPEADAFENGELARLFMAWRRFLLTQGLPRVSAFVPRLGRLMAFSGIVEHAGTPAPATAEADLRWRLAGSGLCRLTGREISGEEVFRGWQRFERATLRRLLAQTLEQQQAFLARLQIQLNSPMELASVEMLALPLLDGKRGMPVALLVLLPDEDPGIVAHACLETARLTSLRTLHVNAPETAATHEECHLADVLPLFGRQRQPA